MGLLDFQRNLSLLLIWAIVYGLIFSLLALAATLIHFRGKKELRLLAAVIAVAFGLLIVFSRRIPWFDVLRPLPLMMASVATVSACSFYRNRTDAHAVNRLVLQFAMAVFAFVMLLKIIFFVRIYHYGFILAMPATLMGICILTCWIPNAIRKRGGSSSFFLAAALVFLPTTAD